MLIRYFALLCCLSGLFVLSCDAPHDNPLDPESKHFNGSLYALEDFSGRVRSLHTSRNFPTTDVYSVIVEGWTNQEIDLDSLWVVYDGKSPVDLERIELGLWGASFSSSYFNSGDPTMVGVLGQPFVISFAITGDKVYTLEPLHMVRVIDETPTVISPSSSDTVGQRPLLEWNAFNAPYDFWFQASVWRDEIDFEVETWRSEMLPDSIHDIETGDILITGKYYWVLYVIDEFSNRSRSRQGEFVVMEESE